MAKKSVLNKKSLAFLESYINNASPTGFETQGQKMWLDYLKPYIDDYQTDIYGSVAAVINPGQDYKVAIEAHADEISWFVHYITDKGFIYLRRNGGSDHMIAPSKRVVIHTEKGPVRAIFGWPAIHTRGIASGKDEAPSMKNIFLDCGCSSKEDVEKLGVHVGCVVTFEDEFMTLNDSYFVGRAFDNRAGGFMIAEVARLLHQNKKELPFTLYVVNAVQEEIGLRGAEMISRTLEPDVAIITDVCHDTQTPMINKIEQGDFYSGKGPVLTYGPAVQNNLLKKILKTAESKAIPFQRAAVSRSTGTDTDAFAYSGKGVASALISLPLRYMHTTVETIHRDDVENVIKLIYETLLTIEKGESFSYFA
ncbi:MAG: M42 family metallopeptidase [Flavobacteriales bacterium]|nr:M42 family metallopeptidase [Flavobacteriales bacterium]